MMFAPFDNNAPINNPVNSKPQRITPPRNDYYVGHIYSTMSTIPEDYIFWYKYQTNKNLTITGESKAQIIKLFKKALVNSNLEVACNLGIELHCSNYLSDIINIFIEVFGNFIHIHNPHIGSRILNRYLKYEKQIELPKDAGTTNFPESSEFFQTNSVQKYNSTLNCQPIRNFVIELITVTCLSHQKEVSLPKISPKDLTPNHLYKAARLLKIGGTNLNKVIKKEPLKIILEVIEKNILFKTPKVDKAIYWILWLVKVNSDIKCKHLQIDGVPRKETNHWVWHIWKSIFKRVSFLDKVRKQQIKDLYSLFKINFTKKIIKSRLPLVFFTIKLLGFNLQNQLPSILNNLHLHIQAYSNVNVLYKNLQIKLMRRSWIDVAGEKVKEKKIPKKEQKEQVVRQKKSLLSSKMEYLNIIPHKSNNFD